MPATLSAPLLAFAATALTCAALGAFVADRPPPQRFRPRLRSRGGGGGVALAALRMLALGGRALRPLARVTAPRELAARVAAAGRPGGLGARELMAAKGGAAIAGGAWGAALGASAPGRLGLLIALAAPVAGFLAPDAWLHRRAAQRARRARAELPALLDLLRVSIEAGMAPAAALGSVGERSDGPVGVEWRAVAAAVELGVPLTAALVGMASRLPLPEVEALCAVLARTASQGSPPGRALAAQARETRLAQRRRMQERAARAGPKIQLVVALLLVPSVLLLVAAALAGALLSGDGSLVVGG